MTKPLVKCQECGFLAIKKAGIHALPMCGATIDVRDNAIHIEATQIDGTGPFDPAPYCYLSAIRIDLQYRDDNFRHDGERDARLDFLTVVRHQRECDAYCRWDGIKSPQEYTAMQERIEMAKIAESARAREFRERLYLAAVPIIAAIGGYLFHLAIVTKEAPATFPTSMIMISAPSTSTPK